MVSSALTMALLGISACFFPREILDDVQLTSAGIAPLMVQVLGSLYIGFAVLNWMLRSSPIGGIYSRPLAMANFTHFTIGFLSIVKAVISDPKLMALWIPCFVYLIFASLFGSVLFKRSARK
jgi:hypothetical protein